MKKIFALLFAAASMMTAVSCNRVFDEKEVPSDGTIYITRTYKAGLDEATKTFAEASGKVNWEQGDVIRYYSINNGTVGEVVLPEGGAKAQLPLEVAANASYLVCVHGGFLIKNPSADGLTIVGAVNNAQSGVFGDSHVALVKSSDVSASTLTFHNIVSYYKFTFIIDDVKSVVFKSNDGTQLHSYGNVNVSFSGDETTASLGSGGDSKITVNNGGRGTFYIAALPGTLQNGFTIDCYDSAHSLIGSVKTTKAVELKPNSILNLGVLDTRITQEYVDLSAPGTANSYIVSETGFYKFKTVKGNSSESAGSVASAEALWESFGTNVAPSVGDLVSNVYVDGDYIKFRASALKGNAVIAAKNASGTILWSWHIWLTDAPEDQVYNNNAGTMMDRNLGATSATPGDAHALGLQYEWGRKDPFLSGNSITSSTKAASTITWPAPVTSNATHGTLTYSISNPTTYIVRNTTNNDWHYTGSSSYDNTRWQTLDKAKGLYDPCPIGYRVPEESSTGIWEKAFGTTASWTNSANFDSTNKGMNFSNTDKKLGSASTIWYPAAGGISYDSGSYSGVGNYGYYWSCSPKADYHAYSWYLHSDGTVKLRYGSVRASGKSIRCQKM